MLYAKDERSDFMKKRWISWWITNCFWAMLFVLGTIMVWTRKVDGAGAIQTPEIKLLSFIVLVLAFVIPLVIQIVWLVVNVRTSK